MKEQEFKVELERFKQKANWEKTIFYFSLTALWGIIIISIKDDLKLLGLNLIWWILILGVLMNLGEFFVENYLDTQANILRKKVAGKDAKIWDDKKLLRLVVLERKLEKKTNISEEIKSEITNLKNEIWGKK
ncbi:MAG: hypothetical protein AABX11_04820 [Nanoarchaeota archaeon]